MPTEYKQDILTVVDDDIVIGYMARRSNVVGFGSDTPNGWMITKNILSPHWSGNYGTRVLAKEALQDD